MHEQTANAAIIRMGFGGELVAHGMRSIARTAAEESGKFRTEVLESALAHTKNNEIIAAYNRGEYLAERTELMQWWGSYIQAQKHNSMISGRDANLVVVVDCQIPTDDLVVHLF